MKKILFITFVAVVIPFIVFGFIGCVKAPKNTVDYGTPVSEDAVVDALKDTIQNTAPPTPLLIQKSQYVYIEHSQALDIYDPIIISQRGDTVLDRGDTSTNVTLGIDIQLNELQPDGTMQFSRSHSDLTIDKISPSNPPTTTEALKKKNLSAQASATPQPVQIQDYSIKSLKTQSADPTVTYYNLQKSRGIMPVPDLVKARPDCGGVPNCAAGLRYEQISFDRVVTDGTPNGTRTSIQYIFSPDVPTYIYDWDNSDDMFPTNQISECAQQWVPQVTNGAVRYIPVRDCRDLLDFHFGPTPPSS